MNKLFIFDFDDTLAVTSNKIFIKKADGRKMVLTSDQYPSYVKEPGDEFDFNDFRTPRSSRKVQHTVELLMKAIEEFGINSVVILTARITDEPVRRFLEDHNIPKVQIMPVGREGMHSHPDDKAFWIKWVISKFKPKEVHFFDDHPGNVKAVQNLKMDGTKIKTYLIKTKSPI